MVTASRAGMAAAYAYDIDDRRIGKTVTQTSTISTRTLWSGTDELAEYDGAGALLRRVIPGPAIDDKVAVVEASGAVRYFHTDRLGSVVAVSNGAGSASETYAYSPYGESANPVTGNPWRFTGRYLDAETGLYYYRARYYSPRLGQFLQTDPIGSKDDPNLYMYVGLDPGNKTDPSGKWAWLVIPALRCAFDARCRAVVVMAVRSVVAQVSATGRNGARAGGWAPSEAEIEFTPKSSPPPIITPAPHVQTPTITTSDAAPSEKPRRAPPPNNGTAAQHGKSDHNDPIDERAKEVEAMGATDIRKNQAQVNADGEKVGDNRPDLGYTLNGVRVNEEWGRSPERLREQSERARKNDPQCLESSITHCIPRPPQ